MPSGKEAATSRPGLSLHSAGYMQHSHVRHACIPSGEEAAMSRPARAEDVAVEDGALNAVSRPDTVGEDEASEVGEELLWGSRNRVPLEKRNQPPRLGADRLRPKDRLASSTPVGMR
eukprot:1161384-Pelagomonas_calceolata.AAC.2